jgi:hypothetical protein
MPFAPAFFSRNASNGRFREMTAEINSVVPSGFMKVID